MEFSFSNMVAWLRRKSIGLLLNGPRSSFNMKVNCAIHLKFKVPESGGNLEKFRNQIAWMSFPGRDDLRGHVLWCWSTMFYQVHHQHCHQPGDFRALHASVYCSMVLDCPLTCLN